MSEPIPQISPDLAAKVLAADTRNAIKNVGDGGTLPAAHRREMKVAALTPSAAKEARVASLVQKWVAGGELTPEQRAEVLEAHPDFDFGPVSSSSDSTNEHVSVAEHISAEQIAEWQRTYDTKRRQIYRWLKIGRQKKDPCPLSDPGAMPKWWARNMKHVAPEKLALAAAKVAIVENLEKNLGAETGAADAPSHGAGMVMNLNVGEMGEGEAVRQARQIVAMCYGKLAEAMNAEPPDLAAAQLWQVRWEKSVEALRKQERDDREARKQAGELLPKGQLLTEAAQLLEALRLAHGSMGVKIIAELGKKAEGRKRRVLQLIEPDLISAIETVRCREAELFASLETFGSRTAVGEAFALQAA